jgi:hypothetical protein
MRSPEEWLEEATHFEAMAKRFDKRPRLSASFALLAKHAVHRATQPVAIEDVDYFRMRAAREQSAALDATDARVSRVHREMADRYRQRLGNSGLIVTP